MQRFYTPREVAALLGVSPTTVMKLIHRGELPAVRVSERVYRIPVPALERYVSGEQQPEFEVHWRNVKRIGKLGEPMTAAAEELVEA